MKSTVFAILALSSAKVSSVSSCLGTSTPARRATAPLAVSQAICTWRFIGNMSGKSLHWVRTVGWIFFASEWASALSRIAERFLSALTKRGALAWYMEMFMESSESGNEACILPHGPRPGRRVPRADPLFDELREDKYEADDGYQPGQRADPDDSRDVDHRVGEPGPEEELGAVQRHVVRLARHHRHQHERCEQHQVLEHVPVRARRAASPACDLGHAFAVAHERHETHLVERRLRRHQHLHNSQNNGPHQQ